MLCPTAWRNRSCPGLSTPQRERLATSMTDVERLLRASAITIEIEPSGSEDALWCLDRYYDELDRRFENGFDQRLGNASTSEDFAPPHGQFVIAREGEAPVGCGALKSLGDGIGEIKRVWVSSSVRGLGVASRIMDRLEGAAREMGFTRLCLDTNKALTEAHAMYRNRGYAETERYNDNPFAHLWLRAAVVAFRLSQCRSERSHFLCRGVAASRSSRKRRRGWIAEIELGSVSALAVAVKGLKGECSSLWTDRLGR